MVESYTNHHTLIDLLLIQIIMRRFDLNMKYSHNNDESNLYILKTFIHHALFILQKALNNLNAHHFRFAFIIWFLNSINIFKY